MTVFQLVKTVLDELYQRIPGTEAEKDPKIGRMIMYLREQYMGLARGLTVDYADPTTRFAYIYVYVTAHANIVYQMVRASHELQAILERDKVNVSCIGGGPGSDFLGILKYLLIEAKEPFLRCMLLDREANWGECWNDVDEKLATSFRITNNFQPFDVIDPIQWQAMSKYLSADLFTMIYFMSEVYALRVPAEAFFLNMFRSAKPGALFLYVDNNNQQFYGVFDSLVSTTGLVVLSEGQRDFTITDLSERKTDLGRYWDKFERIASPKLTANAVFRICQKPI